MNYREALAQEAKYLHRHYFGRECDSVTVERYVRAHEACPAFERGSRILQSLIAHNVDAEAAEYALRRRSRTNALTLKSQILFYLVEARGADQFLFANDANARGQAWMRLAGALLRAMYKGVKGEYLLRRYGLL